MIYITKYALTKGIIEAELIKTDSDRATVPSLSNPEYRQMFYKGEWFYTLEQAKIRAEEMREAKLKSLDKQMKKVSAIKF